MANNGWSYATVSVEMISGTSTTFVFFVNNLSVTTVTSADVFLIDKASYPAFLGLERTAAATYSNHFHGFIYEFLIY